MTTVAKLFNSDGSLKEVFEIEPIDLPKHEGLCTLCQLPNDETSKRIKTEPSIGIDGIAHFACVELAIGKKLPPEWLTR